MIKMSTYHIHHFKAFPHTLHRPCLPMAPFAKQPPICSLSLFLGRISQNFFVNGTIYLLLFLWLLLFSTIILCYCSNGSFLFLFLIEFSFEEYKCLYIGLWKNNWAVSSLWETRIEMLCTFMDIYFITPGQILWRTLSGFMGRCVLSL